MSVDQQLWIVYLMHQGMVVDTDIVQNCDRLYILEAQMS